MCSNYFGKFLAKKAFWNYLSTHIVKLMHMEFFSVLAPDFFKDIFWLTNPIIYYLHMTLKNSKKL